MIGAVAESAALAPARALLANLPKLHYWGSEEQVGGLNSVIGDRMITVSCARYDSPRVIDRRDERCCSAVLTPERSSASRRTLSLARSHLR